MSSQSISNGVTASTAGHAQPLVSVIIPFYDQERYLADTVKSVATDGHPRVEIIVIDDGSPVPAEPLLSQMKNLVLIRTENRGVNAARNLGFQRSSGAFLLFLDSDDRLVPGAIQSHLEALAASPNAALSFGAVSTIDEEGKMIAPPHICRPRDDYFLKLLETNFIATPGGVLIRRDAFLECGTFDEEFRMAEDYRLYLKIARRHALVLNRKCVLERRMHATNTSKNLEPMLAATMKVLNLVEIEEKLSPREQRSLSYGRRRWQHIYRPRPGVRYRLRSLYYSLGAMRSVSPSHYLWRPVK